MLLQLLVVVVIVVVVVVVIVVVAVVDTAAAIVFCGLIPALFFFLTFFLGVLFNDLPVSYSPSPSPPRAYLCFCAHIVQLIFSQNPAFLSLFVFKQDIVEKAQANYTAAITNNHKNVHFHAGHSAQINAISYRFDRLVSLKWWCFHHHIYMKKEKEQEQEEKE